MAPLYTGTYIARTLLIVAHLAGLVVAIMLLVRKKGTAAVLAAVAFGLLILLDIGYILDLAFLREALGRAIRSARGLAWATGGLNCCCGLFDLIAVGCLIAALWIGLGGPKAKEEAPPEEEIEESPA